MSDRRLVRRRRSRRSRLAVLLLAAAGSAAVAFAAAAPMKLPQTWSGRAILPEGVEPGLTADYFEIKVSTLSSDKELMTLGAALRKGGQREVREEMFRIPPKGWIRFGKLVATDLNVIRVIDLPDGRRRLRLISDHPLRLYDKSDPAGSDAHPFGYIELVVDASGAGSGTLIAAASLSFVDGGLMLDSAGAPVIAVEDVHSDAAPPR